MELIFLYTKTVVSIYDELRKNMTLVKFLYALFFFSFCVPLSHFKVEGDSSL